MHEHFIALSRRQAMTLLTALTYGGRDAIETFDHLPEAEAAVLRERALAIVGIPRDRRVPLMVQELRRLMAEAHGKLWAADPARIARILRKERPAMVEVALRALPIATAEAVRVHVPTPKAPPTERETSPLIAEVVKWKLGEALRRAAHEEGRAPLDLQDLPSLSSRELATLCDRLGAFTVARLLTALPQPACEAWAELLRPDLRRLVAASVSGSGRSPLTEAEGRQALAGFGEDPSSALRAAGASEVVRGALSHSLELAQRIAERHRNGVGELLARWIRESGATDSASAESRREVLAEMERLADEGIIDRSAIRERRERWRREK